MPKPRKLKPGIQVRAHKCATCVFGPNHANLPPARLAEIQQYVLRGTNQLCHHDNNKTICRGGRDYQLQCWYRLGVIRSPDASGLQKAMETHQ